MSETNTSRSVPAKDTGTLASLRVANFRVLLVGTTLSNAAQWIQQVTLSWLVYDLTGSGTMIGTISLVRSVSSLGLAPLAGVAIDRASHRWLLVLVKLWLLIISVALGVALLSGQREVWPLFAFTFLGGVAQSIDMPLRQTITFDLVPRALTPNAIALIQTGWSLMRSLGPGIGGFIILWFGPGGNFLVQAGAYALIIVSIWWIHFPPQCSTGQGRPALQSARDGIGFVWRERTTRCFTMMGWILPLIIVPVYNAMSPIFAKSIFAGGPEVLGLLMSAVGVGGILGGIFTASLGRVDRRGLVQLASLFLLSLTLIGFALSSELWLALLMLAVSGFFEMIFLTTNQTLLQLSIPDELRGRVTGIVSLNASLSPLGGLVAGVGADLFGARLVTVLLGVIAAAIAVGVFIGSSTVREYRLSHTITPGSTKAASGDRE